MDASFMTSSAPSSLLVFTVADEFGALPLPAVERVLRAAALVKIPDCPKRLEGLLNLGGDGLPVISMRHKLGLPERVIVSEDYLIVVSHGNGRFVIRSEAAPWLWSTNDENPDSKKDLSTLPEAIGKVYNINGLLVPLYIPEEIFVEAEALMSEIGHQR